jgi:phosphatidylglycerophosphate synthase
MSAQESTHGAVAVTDAPPPAPPGALEAVLLASGPSPALRFADGTLLDRLRGQLETLGAGATHVLTADAADDLRAIAAIARAGDGPLVVAAGDVLAHREALATLLADPRLDTAILAGADGPPVRSSLGRVVAAGSAFHRVRAPDAAFAGVLKVARGDRPRLADVAERLAVHAADWDDDAAALLVVGLVRAHVRVGVARLGGLTCARPRTPSAVAAVARELAGHDEDRVRLDAAVKANDGLFTSFLVSPYSKYVARWAAHRGLTPNQVTTVSLALGVAAAAAFAAGTRAWLVAGAVLLQASFTADCIDGQLARYARRFSALGAWLDSVFDRVKEYAVYAGLALGAGGAWALAGAALALQTFRHFVEFSYAAASAPTGSAGQPPLEEPDDAPPAPPARGDTPRPAAPRFVWLRKLIGFPIGERFAAVSLAAALASGRVALIVVLAWGGFAAVYTVAGRSLRALR